MTTSGVRDAGDVLGRHRVVPTVTVASDDAVALARALVRGGVTIMEVLIRPSTATDTALDSVRAVGAEVPSMTVGVGTVSDPDQLEAAAAVGAAFAVSPGFSVELAARAGELGLPYLPGVMTPTEIAAARADGLRTVKLFPAAMVGIAGLDALSAAFDDVRFVPTGGIDADRAAGWLAHPAVVAVGGSWIAPRAIVAAGDWDAVTARAIQALRP